ncbi:MAG: Hpt domain-containing protein [Bdellovibrionota bacterium]
MTQVESRIPAILKEAAVIFLTELEQHSNAMSEALSDTGAPLATLTANAKNFSERFHTVKGGAGFLQLDRLKALATDGEKLFKQPIDSGNCDAVMDQFKQLLSGLQEELVLLRAELAQPS